MQINFFTCRAVYNTPQKQNVKISMDGKGRAIDNIWIERFWKTIKLQLPHFSSGRNRS